MLFVCVGCVFPKAGVSFQFQSAIVLISLFSESSAQDEMGSSMISERKMLFFFECDTVAVCQLNVPMNNSMDLN